MRKCKLCFIIFVFLIFLFMKACSVGFCEEGNTLYVGGNNDYKSIQDAINASSNNDTIIVTEGTYYENFIINKSINLVGADKNSTIIDGTIKSNSPVITIFSNKVNISNLTIQKSIGIDMGDNKNCTINNNLFYDCHMGIISLSLNCTCSGENNSITRNIIKNCFKGIYFGDSHNNTISDNMIINNDLGIDLFISFNNHIYNNDFSNNTMNVYDGNEFLSNKYNNNYWDDYTGSDTDSDGIGDEPYQIPGGENIDEFPMMESYNKLNYTSNDNNEFTVDLDLVIRTLAIGFVIAFVFLLPIAFYWRKKIFK